MYKAALGVWLAVFPRVIALSLVTLTAPWRHSVSFSRRTASKTNSLSAFSPEDDRNQEGIKSCYYDSQPTAPPVALMSVCLFINRTLASQLTLIQIRFSKWCSPSVRIKTGLAHQRTETTSILSQQAK